MCVYFCYDSETRLVKIGFTDERDRSPVEAAYQRVVHIASKHQKANLWLLGTLPGMRSRESQLHEQFASSVVHGEWFALTDEVKRFLLTRDFPVSTKVHLLPPGGIRKYHNHRSVCTIFIDAEILAAIDDRARQLNVSRTKIFDTALRSWLAETSV